MYIIVSLFLILSLIKPFYVVAFDPDMKNVSTPSARASGTPVPTMTSRPTAMPKVTTKPTPTPVVLAVQTQGPTRTIVPSNLPNVSDVGNENKWDMTSLVMILVICMIGAAVGGWYSYKEFRK